MDERITQTVPERLIWALDKVKHMLIRGRVQNKWALIVRVMHRAGYPCKWVAQDPICPEICHAIILTDFGLCEVSFWPNGMVKCVPYVRATVANAVTEE